MLFRSEERINLNIGNVYIDQGDYTKALEYYLNSLKVVQELSDKQIEEKMLLNIGNVYSELGDYTKAMEYYENSLKIAQELGDKKGEETGLGNIGYTYYDLGDYTKALELCVNQLAHARTNGDWFMEGYTLSLIGQIYFEKQEFLRAYDSLKHATKILEQIDERPDDGLHSWLALVAMKLGNRNNATEELKKVEELFKDIPESGDYSVCWNLSQTYSDLGNTAKAKEYLDKAYNEVISCSEKISDNAMKQSYLTNVKLNREIVAAWKRK